MKKTLSLVLICMLLFTSVAAAARAKIRPIAPRTSGSVITPVKPAAPAVGATKPTAPNYNDKGTSNQTKSGMQQSAQPVNNSHWRTAGLIGGGMLLGSMLSTMFGFGHVGFLGPLFGIIINLLMAGALFVAVRYVWRKVTQPSRDYYHR